MIRQSALRNMQHRLQAFEPGTARAQVRPQIGSRSSRGVRSAPFFRADSESAHESGPRGAL
eukprot:10234724-Alexandrium_andersonii.AAC.1